MKRFFFGIVLITTLISAKSENLISIDEMILKRPNATSDPIEVEYFLTRCAALYISVHGRFNKELELTEPSNRLRLEDIVSRTMAATRFFFTHATNMALRNGNSEEFLEKRTGSLALIYNDKLSNGILLHNDMLKYVEGDFVWCANLMESSINIRQ